MLGHGQHTVQSTSALESFNREPDNQSEEQLIEGYVHSILSALPIMEKRYCLVRQCCEQGWAEEVRHNHALKPYCATSGDLNVAQGLLLKGHPLQKARGYSYIVA